MQMIDCKIFFSLIPWFAYHAGCLCSIGRPRSAKIYCWISLRFSFLDYLQHGNWKIDFTRQIEIWFCVLKFFYGVYSLCLVDDISMFYFLHYRSGASQCRIYIYPVQPVFENKKTTFLIILHENIHFCIVKMFVSKNFTIRQRGRLRQLLKRVLSRSGHRLTLFAIWVDSAYQNSTPWLYLIR